MGNLSDNMKIAASAGSIFRHAPGSFPQTAEWTASERDDRQTAWTRYQPALPYTETGKETLIMAQHHYLVIVESPTKVKTISKFLSRNYTIMASSGHVRDLPKSQLGFDAEHDYEPKYITIRGKGDVLAALRKEARKADKVYLATDPDREGEAISWHLVAALKLDPEKTFRITFNEITKTAVKEALKHPRQIDMDMVDAQQTRRILDRMVGYRISPLLWAKIKRGLSAGRVQSVALRIISDREAEIAEFIPQEYWTIDAELRPHGAKKNLTAQYHGTGSGKELPENSDRTLEIEKALRDAVFTVTSVKKGERTRKAPLPFTTSTLQQEAAKALNFSTQKTMRVAQQLYEGVRIKGEGTVGLITYLRTDSTRISKEAAAAASAYISEQYGPQYAASQSKAQPSGGSAEGGQRIQDAHEAIRPTDIRRLPSAVKEELTREQLKLYELIWKRFTGSCMAPARIETLQIKITAKSDLDYMFTTGTSRTLFEGFQAVYRESGSEEDKVVSGLGELKEGDELELKKLDSQQHFTQPPAHFTEASLVHTLEEKGIGRPSTYAPTISTLLARHYVTKEGRSLYVTELGEAVNSIMKGSFPEIDDVGFTANMESLLDLVADGKMEWKDIVRNFYPDLEREVQRAEETLSKVTIADEETDVLCDKCGRRMVIKYGPHGKFLGCPGFPDCRNTMPYYEKAGVKCPKCGMEVVLKRSRKGRKYYGCENTECDFISWSRPSEVRCPKCGGWMAQKGNRIVCQNNTCGYSCKDEHDSSN